MVETTEQTTTTNSFLAQARWGKNHIWRYLFTLGLTVFLTVSASILITVIVLLVEGTTDLEALSPYTTLLLSMLPFAFIILGLWAGLRFMHRRPFLSLVNPWGKFDWKRLLLSAVIWLVISAVSDVVLSLLQPGNYTFTLNIRQFLPFALLALVLVPIQTSAEELLFRGYLTQGFGLAGGGLWYPLIAPAIFFGLLHSWNPEIDRYGLVLMLAFYIGMGLLLGWITLRSQSLELALGLHAANNLYATLLVTYPGSAIAAPALWQIRQYDARIALAVFVVDALIYLVLIRLVFKKG